jgi:CHAT domain-containing protein
MFRILFILLLLLNAALGSFSQKPDYTSDSSIYKVYGEQLTSLLAVRGVPGNEIKEILNIYEKNAITSDENLAVLLGKLFPRNAGIGIIFYFFNNDTLRTVLFEPGKVKDVTHTPVSKTHLLQLSTDLNHVLGLYNDADKRMPVKRGLKPVPPAPTKNINYEGVINQLTDLLLPKSFDSSYKHLLIIPALNIGTIPFYLLTPYGDKSLVVDRCSYTVVPGIVDLLGLRVKTLKLATRWQGDIADDFDDNYSFKDFDSTRFTLKNPLFISNPVYPQDLEFSFPDLPGAKKEIKNAMRYADDYVLLEGANAKKDTVLKYIGGADLVYFATHGVADLENPMEKSFLVLSGNDPLLTAKDIMDVRKNYNRFPEMVILSACQTGLGKSMEAGVAGLARSFLLAGANHIIMSLWNVDDEATAFLMGRYIHYLQYPSLFMPSEPLRRAALETRKRFPKPSQWAGFSLFGIDY